MPDENDWGKVEGNNKTNHHYIFHIQMEPAINLLLHLLDDVFSNDNFVSSPTAPNLLTVCSNLLKQMVCIF